MVGMLVATTVHADGLGEIGTSQGPAESLPTIKAPTHLAEKIGTAQTVTAQGEVEIAQYGQYEEDLAYRNGGFLAVRFDPPFTPPYTIKSIRFPSMTMDGAQAVFPSVSLVAYQGASSGLPINQARFRIAPLIGSPNGMNEVPVEYAVTDSGQTFYVCVEFPSTAAPEFPNNFPFMRMDYKDLEHGLFANSYDVSPRGSAFQHLDRNIVVSLLCRLPDTAQIPIEASSNLGVNGREGAIEFTFTPSRDLAVDGTPIPRNSLRRTLLLYRKPFGAWSVIDSAGPGKASMSLPSLPVSSRNLWATQAVDKNGNRAMLSSGPFTNSETLYYDGISYDLDEPNGSLRESKAVTSMSENSEASCAPAGDQDFYGFLAAPGDLITVSAAPYRDGNDDQELALILYDRSGRVVAEAHETSATPGALLTYAVPHRSARSRDKSPQQFTVLIRDIRGSYLLLNSQPRVGWNQFVPGLYIWALTVEPQAALAKRGMLTPRLGETGIRIEAVESGTKGVSLTYTLPGTSGAPRTSIRVFDLQGRLVRTLLDRVEAPGQHAVAWDGFGDRGARLPAGVYFARLQTTAGESVAKVVLSR
jgi:hypothetical protein